MPYRDTFSPLTVLPADCSRRITPIQIFSTQSSTYRSIQIGTGEYTPPLGLPSNNFSVVWEGELEVPVDGSNVDGYIGIAVYANNMGRLYVDDILVAQSELSDTGTVMGNIQSLGYVLANVTITPPGGAPFTWRAGARHKIRIEFQVWNLWQKVENVNSINAQVELFWNPVDRTDPVRKAVDVANEADVVVLAVGASGVVTAKVEIGLTWACPLIKVGSNKLPYTSVLIYCSSQTS